MNINVDSRSHSFLIVFFLISLILSSCSDQQLVGIQVIVDSDRSSEFVKSSGTTENPRSLFLNKDGMIITDDTPRLSDSSLQTLFSKYIS